MNNLVLRNNSSGFFAPVDAWLNYKLSLADKLKPDMDAIDNRIYPNVVTIIKAAI